MTEAEYQEFVMADYDEKKAAGVLPSELMSPTPAGIKSEAVKVCEHRFNPKDERTLISFFNKKDDMHAYRTAIQNHDAAIFRPLVNFLDDRTIRTKFKNIQLLAWLIDFRPRPFRADLTIPPRRPSKSPEPEPDNYKLADTRMNSKKSGLTRWLYAGAALLVCLVGVYWIVERQTRHAGSEGCMTWKGDRYEPVDCNAPAATTPVFPINQKMLESFRMITKPDTLTVRSVGRVWYAKYNGRVEFYTMPGPHPLDTNRRLLPMSVHILEKYVYHTVN